MVVLTDAFAYIVYLPDTMEMVRHYNHFMPEQTIEMFSVSQYQVEMECLAKFNATYPL